MFLSIQLDNPELQVGKGFPAPFKGSFIQFLNSHTRNPTSHSLSNSYNQSPCYQQYNNITAFMNTTNLLNSFCPKPFSILYNSRNTNSSIAGTSPIFLRASLFGSSSTPIAIIACFLLPVLPTLIKLTFTFSSPSIVPTCPIIPG